MMQRDDTEKNGCDSLFSLANERMNADALSAKKTWRFGDAKLKF